MNQPNVTGVSSGVQTPSPGFFSRIGGWQTMLGLFLILAGGGIIGAGQSSKFDDSSVWGLRGGGIVTILIGIAIIFVTGERLKAFENWRQTSGWYSILLPVVIIAIIIAIFTIVFYIYAPSEMLPFATYSLIGLTVLGILGLLLFFGGRAQLQLSITRFLLVLYFFLPYALFTFGFLIDAINQRFQYAPASLAGLTGVLFNYALSIISSGQPTPYENALCEIPGLALLHSTLAPQPMMFTLTITAHIATYISRSKFRFAGTTTNPETQMPEFATPEGYRWPVWVLHFAITLLYLIVLARYGCFANNKTSAIWGICLPLLYGGITGLIQSATSGESFVGSNVVETFISEAFSQIAAIEVPAVPKNKQPSKTSASSSSAQEVATCAKGAKDGEFVCESFENGVLKSQVMTE